MKTLIRTILIFSVTSAAFTACPSMDATGDCRVDFKDFVIFATQWMTEGDPDDMDPPEPIAWASQELGDDTEGAPVSVSATSITMTAHTAQDLNPPVEYRFLRFLDTEGTIEDPAFAAEVEFDENTQTDLPKRRWRTETTFTDANLETGIEYTYRFQARDSVGNISPLSTPASAVTVIPDTQAPTPNPSQWDIVPELMYVMSKGSWYVTMTAARAADNKTPAGQVEYYFDCNVSDFDSGWVSDEDSSTRPHPLDDTGTIFLQGNQHIKKIGGKRHTSWVVRTRDKAPVPNVSDDSTRIYTINTSP